MPPSVRGVGAAASQGATSPLTVPVPTGGGAPQSGDAMYIVGEWERAGNTTETPPDTPSGWTSLFTMTEGSGTSDHTGLYVFGKIAGASEADVDIAWSGTGPNAMNHISGQMIVVSDHGLAAITDTVVGTGNSATSGTTATALGITVTAGSLVLIVATSTDDQDSTAFFSDWTNANLASITERMDFLHITGRGGGHGMATGTCAGTTTGNSTVTLAVDNDWIAVHLGIPPVSGAQQLDAVTLDTTPTLEQSTLQHRILANVLREWE